MWNLVIRLALMGGTLLVFWNVTRVWLRALGQPRKTLATSPEDRTGRRAREMAEAATKWLTDMRVEVAALDDAEMWAATEGFAAAVERLIAAMLADPGRYRKARRLLGQVLYAAEQAVRHFARHQRANRDATARRRFLELARELEAAYSRAADDYARAGAAELAIEADVLRELLRRENS